MKYTDLLQLKSVQVVLLIVALVGAFFVGRWSGPEPIKEPIKKTVQGAVPGEQPQPVKPETNTGPEGKRASKAIEKIEPVGSGNTLAESPVVLASESAGSTPVLFGFKYISMVFRNRKAFDPPPLYPFSVMITVLKDTYTAVSTVTAGRMDSESDFKYFQYDSLIHDKDKLNGTGAEEPDNKLNLDEQCGEGGPEILCWCYSFPKPSAPFVKSETVKPEPVEADSEQPCPPGPSAEKGEKMQIEQLEKQPFKVLVPGRKKKKKISSREGFLGYDASACAGNLVRAVQAAVADVEARSILYGTGPLSDCSGIFHRVLRGVKKRCPDYEYPPLKRYRDSRDLARWYREQGELILIRNALKRTDVIRPGMVLFYGRRGSVRHVGVVVSVARDKNGKVVSYKLFHGHGRRGKTVASTTNWHKRHPDRAGYPPFGNGRQHLIAAARIVRPVKAKQKMNKER